MAGDEDPIEPMHDVYALGTLLGEAIDRIETARKFQKGAQARFVAEVDGVPWVIRVMHRDDEPPHRPFTGGDVDGNG